MCSGFQWHIARTHTALLKGEIDKRFSHSARAQHEYIKYVKSVTDASEYILNYIRFMSTEAFKFQMSECANNELCSAMYIYNNSSKFISAANTSNNTHSIYEFKIKLLIGNL